MNPRQAGLFAGVAGVRPGVADRDFEQGVHWEEISCFVSGTDLAAALSSGAPEVRRQRSPIHLAAQISIPEGFQPGRSLDRINAIWWFAMLLRLRSSPLVRVPLIAAEPLVREPWRQPSLAWWPLEVDPRAPFLVAAPCPTVSGADLDWVQAHWLQSARWLVRNADFNRAAKALDEAYASADPGPSLLALWQALDLLFSPERPASSVRLPANLATFLAPQGGDEGEALAAEIGGLHPARTVAEVGGEPGLEGVRRVYDLARLAFLKIVEDDHVPARSEIEACRFRAGPH